MINEIKQPMIVFGERLDKLYKKRKFYGKLPKYFANLFPNYNYKYPSLNNSIDIINNRYKKKLPKVLSDPIIQKSPKIEKNIEIDNKNVFIDFDKNNFVDNINNTGKDYSLFKIKLRKIIPFKYKNQKKINSNGNNKSYSFNQKILKKYINHPKSPSNKLDILNSLNKLYLNNSPFKKKIKMDEKQYIKKWNYPKSIKFDKISGRERKTNIRIYNQIESVKDYCPNYNSIFSNTTKNYVNYGRDIKNYFKNNKSWITRKTICNKRILFNNLSDNYNIINEIKEEEKKKKEEIIKRKRKLYGPLYDFLENCDNSKNTSFNKIK